MYPDPLLPGTTYAADPTSAWPLAGDTGTVLGMGTGQQGVSPSVPDAYAEGTIADAIADVWEWLNTPFRTPMSPVDVALLVGTVIVSILLWNLILYHIRIAGEAL